MTPHIPGRRGAFVRFLLSDTLWNLVIATGSLVGGIAAWCKGRTGADSEYAWWIFAGCVLAFAGALAKTIIAWKRHVSVEAPHALEGALHCLHAMLRATDGGDKPLRVTVHATVNANTLEQVVDYVGGPTSKASPTVGRRFAVNCGIVGKAFREKEAVCADRVNENHEGYVLELVKDWGYTDTQARALSAGPMSWMAIPLVFTEDGRVAGVVYLDSTEKGFFADPTRQALATAGCSGIARFLKLRYN